MSMSLEEVKKIAEDAYIFLYPVVENYKTMWFLSGLFKGFPRFNVFRHGTKLVDHTFTAIVTPNNDTLYSHSWLDLRSEPVVLSIPKDIPNDRYYSMQLIDGYTHNLAILSSRNKSRGDFLIAGPNWIEGPLPASIGRKSVIKSESEYVFLIGRTQVNDDQDVSKVIELQKKYVLTPLSQFAGQAPCQSKTQPEFLPVAPDSLKKAECFFNYANFIMQFIAIHPLEASKFQDYEQIGVSPGQRFPPVGMDPAILHAIQQGLNSGDKMIDRIKSTNSSSCWKAMVNPPMFGNRSVMQGKYKLRAIAARSALYGLNPEEAFYPMSSADANGDAYDSSKYAYVLKFTKDDIPHVNAFWSLTIYTKDHQLVPNEDKCYSIGDRTPGLRYGVEDSLTIYIQKNAPREGKSNWLPAPDGPFLLVMRLFWPKPSALSPLYVPPPVTVNSTVLSML